MPAASRQRASRARREPSDDHIEAGDLTQRNDDVLDSEESDDEQPCRTAKKERTDKKGKAVHRDAVPPLESDDDDGRIDVENFRDQPLDKKEGAKLHGIAQDWELIRKQIHQGSFSLVKDVAISLADVMEIDQSVKALHGVDTIMRELLDIDQEMLSHEETLQGAPPETHAWRARGVMDRYENAVSEKMDQYRSKTSRQKYGTSEVYTQFRECIFEVQNPGVPIPPIKEFIPRGIDDDDDLEIGGVTQDYKCPITLTTLVNPMTSKVCGHSFSGAAIQEYLQKAREDGIACPAAGCKKRLTMAMLRPDKDLEKKIKIAARQRQRRAEDSDDGEVIE
ncbi:hypothetical protein EDD16DRAFT_1691819 [Pisolithus croceorrhizus]|nr:hypothetical protein EDD16DRAFT_1691819 [Pisolithus croceorrhizus]